LTVSIDGIFKAKTHIKEKHKVNIMQKKKVIIVGGGLAGLSAAYELSGDEGFDIHLIEKDNRLGGRVRSFTINGQTIDVGGFLVYPWYKRYHELIKAIQLTEELINIPPLRDYYAGHAKSHDKYFEGFEFSFLDILKIFIHIFPKPLIDSDPTKPELHAYDDLSIQDYLKSLGMDDEKTNYYLRAFDTYLQGYCYGPVTEHKIAFMAATLFQNIFHGDVHSASYFRNGSKVFVDALQAELEKRGVQIHLNCLLEEIDNKHVVTSLGEIAADDFIFCHTPSNVRYSKFITATVFYSGTAVVEDDAEWGSCFYKEDPEQFYPILSIVNLRKLYTEKTARYLNLNIKVNDPKANAISSSDLLEIIKTEMQELFKEITVLEIANRVDWEKAMPIAREDFVESTRSKQGLNNFYYAGDFMGCPSMETALNSGKRAAEKLIKDAK
jgi:protoporphyrinogen oxidase